MGDTPGNGEEGFDLRPVLTAHGFFIFRDGATGVRRDLGLSPVPACGSASILRLRRGRSSESEPSADLRRLLLARGRLLFRLEPEFTSWS